MKLICVKDYDEMSKKAAEMVISLVQDRPRTVLGLATGSTPKGLYKILVEDFRKNGTNYQKVQTFNLDEYIGLDGNHPQSYRYFMNNQLFNHINIPMEQTYIPNGKATNLVEECKRYEWKIKNSGGIDLQLLGIGCNGHIGFNEPRSSFNENTHVVELSESTLQVNCRFFHSINEVPKKAITMGVSTILESKKIILLASGKSKTGAMKRLLSEEINHNFPASALKSHPNVVIIAAEVSLQDIDLNQVKSIMFEKNINQDYINII